MTFFFFSSFLFQSSGSLQHSLMCLCVWMNFLLELCRRGVECHHDLSKILATVEVVHGVVDPLQPAELVVDKHFELTTGKKLRKLGKVPWKLRSIIVQEEAGHGLGAGEEVVGGHRAREAVAHFVRVARVLVSHHGSNDNEAALVRQVLHADVKELSTHTLVNDIDALWELENKKNKINNYNKTNTK